MRTVGKPRRRLGWGTVHEIIGCHTKQVKKVGIIKPIFHQNESEYALGARVGIDPKRRARAKWSPSRQRR